MRVLVCPQEFKGSLTAVDATTALTRGVTLADPQAQIDACPLADGGPGTVDALVAAVGGRYTTTNVDGPLGDPVHARWGRFSDTAGDTAIIEMAAASGLVLVPAERLDPRRASTHGTGQLILAALDAKVRRILVGVGGSATNDAGAGAVSALGARLLDDDDRVLPPGGAALAHLARIDTTGLDERLQRTEVVVLADVRNPLLGPEGATAVYGPQKGVDDATQPLLEHALANFADIVARDLGLDIATVPGGGGAGGLAAGLSAFAGATIQSGFTLIAETVALPERIAQSDLVLTGEGRLDRQSSFGKTVAGVAAMAAQANRPCLAVVGAHEGSTDIEGLTDVEIATPPTLPLAEGMARADELTAAAARRLIERHTPERG
ncbi:MAG: glycerate kinase [Chloroflexi bacterium]|nr:glycerate kinase [Chloroflexota bacterium]